MLYYVEFYSKNKLEKLVHLVGFIIEFITMHGHLNVKLLMFVLIPTLLISVKILKLTTCIYENVSYMNWSTFRVVIQGLHTRQLLIIQL